MTGIRMPHHLAETARRDGDVRAWLTELPARSTSSPGGGRCGSASRSSRAVSARGWPRLPARTAPIWCSRSGSGSAAARSATRLPDCGSGTGTAPSGCTPRTRPGLRTGCCWSGVDRARRWGRCCPSAEQDQVVAGLLRQLWAQPYAAYPFRTLAQMCRAWADEFEQEYAAAGAASRIDPGLARAGIALFRALPESADRQVLLCTDLHGENILAAQTGTVAGHRPQAIRRRSGL